MKKNEDIKGLFMICNGFYLISKNGIIVVTLFVAKIFCPQAGSEMFTTDCCLTEIYCNKNRKYLILKP
jgi:hypothetical protein